MTTIDNKRKQRKRTIFLTHNQGVPGSCPGGPTQLNKKPFTCICRWLFIYALVMKTEP